MNKIENNTFRTRNLNLSAYLVVTGKIELLKIDKTSPQEFWFVFNDPTLCKELEYQYWQDEALVNPKKLLYTLNELKDRMFN